MKEKIENAIIEKTFIGVEDHGILTVVVNLKLPGGGGGFGNFHLGNKDNPHPAFGYFIARVMQVAGVSSWGSLIGTPVRIKHEGAGSIVKSLGHFMKDRWFTPSEELEAYKKKIGVGGGT